MALRRRHREAEVSTESLNDIMFFLLLFFLIMSTMVSPNMINVNLPNSKQEKHVETSSPIHLGINEKREYQVENIKTDFFGLEGVLRQQIAGKEKPVVVLYIDKSLSYQDFIDVLQLGNKLNCTMVCATKPSNS